MAQAEMSSNDVLSILGALDAEQRALEQQQRARQRVRDVIEHFTVITKALPKLESDLKSLGQKMSSLQDNYDAKDASAKQNSDSSIRRFNQAEASAKDKSAQAQERAQLAEGRAADLESKGRQAEAEWKTKIAALEKEYTNIEVRYEAFKDSIGL